MRESDNSVPKTCLSKFIDPECVGLLDRKPTQKSNDIIQIKHNKNVDNCIETTSFVITIENHIMTPNGPTCYISFELKTKLMWTVLWKHSQFPTNSHMDQALRLWRRIAFAANAWERCFLTKTIKNPVSYSSKNCMSYPNPYVIFIFHHL